MSRIRIRFRSHLFSVTLVLLSVVGIVGMILPQQANAAASPALPLPPVPPGGASATDVHVLLLHGLEGFNQANCEDSSGTFDRWGGFLQVNGDNFDGLSWPRSLITTLGYFNGDHSCDDYLGTDSTYPACQGYYDGNEQTNNEDIRHIACRFYWYVYENYTSRGLPVNILAHSMGGIIAKWALSEAAQQNTAQFPYPLLVYNVVTLSTPFQGIPSFFDLGAREACSPSAVCLEGLQLENGSSQSIIPALNNLSSTEGYWTVMGSFGVEPPPFQFTICDAVEYGQRFSSVSPGPSLSAAQVIYYYQCIFHEEASPGSVFPGSTSYQDDTSLSLDDVALVGTPSTFQNNTTHGMPHPLAEAIEALGVTRGPDSYPPAPSPVPGMVALNGSYTFVAIGSALYKYDLGGAGSAMFSGTHLIGTQSFSSPITALAVNGQYLFVALGNYRVVKTTLCGGGANMCALSDGIGSGSLAGYSYWIGYQDFSVPVTGLAATTTYLYTNLAGGGVKRTLKTTLCGSGANMCALSDSIGSGGLPGYSYWLGYQDWAWNPSAIAANDSIVLTTIGSTRVCKTTPGSSGANVFALSDGTCTGTYPGYHYWIGYQDWSQTITNLAIDNAHMWWGLGSQGRLVQTTWCGSGANICALSDGIGTNGLAGYSYWVGHQDWCPGYNQMGVASNGQFADALFSTGGLIRVVKATPGSGANMFATSDCTGTGSLSGYSYWIGSQDFTV